MILVALHSWAIKLLIGSPDKMASVANILSSDAGLSRLRRATYGRSVFVTLTITLRMYIARHRVQWGCWSAYFVLIECTQELPGNVVETILSMQPLHQLCHPGCPRGFVMKTEFDLSLPIELLDVSIKQPQSTAINYGDNTAVHAISEVSWPCWWPTVWLNKAILRIMAKSRCRIEPSTGPSVSVASSLPFQIPHVSAMKFGLRTRTTCTPTTPLTGIHLGAMLARYC
jgi:hypothetical protein